MRVSVLQLELTTYALTNETLGLGRIRRTRMLFVSYMTSDEVIYREMLGKWRRTLGTFGQNDRSKITRI